MFRVSSGGVGILRRIDTNPAELTHPSLRPNVGIANINARLNEQLGLFFATSDHT
jgi:hypothetical protein